MSKQIKITLTKSLIGRKPEHKVIAKQLGLRKMHHSVVHNTNPALLGLVNKIDYLLSVEEIG